MTNNPQILSAEQNRLVAKAAWRILPLLMVAFFISFVDRVNISFAAFQMNRQLHIGPEAFGFAGGLFFVSYFLFELPGNLFMEWLGARVWLARIMIVWGLVATGMALVKGPVSFLSMRFLLGAAEAGLFPGVILYLTYWFPRARRAQFISWFTLAIPLSGFLGSPISAALAQLPPLLGLASWQWLYIFEGTPAVLLGLFCLYWLPDRPSQARWLTPAERNAYQGVLAGEPVATSSTHINASFWHLLINPKILALSLVLAGTTAVSGAYAIWLPIIIKSWGWSVTATGWLNAVPFLVGALAMLLFGYISDKRQERVWLTAIPLLVSTFATFLMLLGGGFASFYILSLFVIGGIYACKGPAWAIATELLPVSARAVGIAQINALSNLVGFFTISLIGTLRAHKFSFIEALLPMAILSAISAFTLLWMQRGRKSAA
ncbi:MAG: MFS transporter [Hyphomicrobiales bacterium]|nr:MFS transporter [Hyphomicrobiales bacterium]MDE2115260.1 MFS transporter [Hyphomicrobiales bacterium]